VGDSVAICAQKGYAVTAVVVDLDGVRQRRADPHARAAMAKIQDRMK
jgi:hypothetical protein